MARNPENRIEASRKARQSESRKREGNLFASPVRRILALTAVGVASLGTEVAVNNNISYASPDLQIPTAPATIVNVTRTSIPTVERPSVTPHPTAQRTPTRSVEYSPTAPATIVNVTRTSIPTVDMPSVTPHATAVRTATPPETATVGQPSQTPDIRTVVIPGTPDIRTVVVPGPSSVVYIPQTVPQPYTVIERVPYEVQVPGPTQLVPVEGPTQIVERPVVQTVVVERTVLVEATPRTEINEVVVTATPTPTPEAPPVVQVAPPFRTAVPVPTRRAVTPPPTGEGADMTGPVVSLMGLLTAAAGTIAARRRNSGRA